MPSSTSYITGDGINGDLLQVQLEFPDAGSVVQVSGTVQPVGGAVQAITPATVTAPAAPGAGTLVWIIQVNKTTGVASVKSQATTAPAVDAGNEVVCTQTLTTTSADLAITPETTPDTV